MRRHDEPLKKWVKSRKSRSVNAGIGGKAKAQYWTTLNGALYMKYNGKTYTRNKIHRDTKWVLADHKALLDNYRRHR